MRFYRPFTLLFAFICCVSLAIPQDDGLFDDAEDIPYSPQADVPTTVEAPRQVLTVSGSGTLETGVLWGWKDEEKDPALKSGFSIGSTINLRAAPNDELALTTGFAIAYPNGSKDSAGNTYPTLTDLYIDLSPGQAVFIRAGKVATGWGSAKIFNIVNLADYSSAMPTIRTSVPFGFGSFVWLLGVPADAFLGNTSEPVSKALEGAVNALRLNFMGSGFDCHLAWRNNLKVPTASDPLVTKPGNDFSAGIKVTFFGIDLYADTLIEAGAFDKYRQTAVGGIFKEFVLNPRGNEKLQTYAEYQYDQRKETEDNDHRSSIVFKFTNLLDPLNAQAGIQWTHSWLDGSGKAVTAVSCEPMSGVTISLGVPIRYGTQEKGTYFSTDNDDRLQLGALFKVEVKY